MAQRREFVVPPGHGTHIADEAGRVGEIVRLAVALIEPNVWYGPLLAGPEEVASYRARFSGVVFPGETIVTSLWDEGDHVVISSRTGERGLDVISNAGIVRR